jgi:hypothetical protein
MSRKKPTRTLGIVPRTLLRGAIAGAIPACALSGCTNQPLALDGSAPGPEAGPADGPRNADHTFFTVDAPAFTRDGGSDAGDAATDATDATRDATDAGRDLPIFSVADIGFIQDRPSSPDLDFFAVDGPAFGG